MFSSSGFSAALLSSLVFSLSPSLISAVTLVVASGQVLQLGSLKNGAVQKLSTVGKKRERQKERGIGKRRTGKSVSHHRLHWLNTNALKATHR